MITLIHGDNTQQVHKKFADLSSDVASSRHEIDLKKQSLENVADILSSQELFSSKRIIIINNLKSLHHTKRKKLFETLKLYTQDPNTHIFIIEEAILDKKVIAKIPTDKLFEFTLPKYFFEYLDNLAPKNAKRISNLISTLSEHTQGEQMFYATLKRVRLLLLFLGDESKFEETKKIAPFFKKKLQQQACAWKEEDLKNFYTSLFEIEVAIKTSNLPNDILEHLDITVQKHLQ